VRDIPFSQNARGLEYAISITQPNETIRIVTGVDDIMLNGLLYEARNSLNVTQIAFSADGTASNADVRISASQTSVRPGIGARGLIDGLQITIELYDPRHPELGTVDMMPGATIGSVSEDTNRIIVFAVQGPLSGLKAPMCEVHTVVCRARLGDARCKVPLAVDDVARNTAYFKKDTNSSLTAGPWDTWARKQEGGSYNDRVYECTTAGTTAATAPTYPTTIGDTVTDGTAVFTCRQAWLCAASGEALDFFNIQLDADPSIDVAVSPNFTLGNIIPRTGDLKDTLIPIKFYDPDTFIVTTWQPFAPSNFPSGTVFEIHPGCDRLMTTCINTFNNLNNFRGTPYAPNSDLQTGRA